MNTNLTLESGMDTHLTPEMEANDDPIVVLDYEAFEEETIDTFHDGINLLATITRNWYGALVLNTTKVMFVDVDLAPRSRIGSDAQALGEKLASAQLSPMIRKLRSDALLKRFNAVADENPDLGFEVYRTAAGFRLIVTSREFDPAEPDAERIFKAFGADSHYARLCKAQHCFRARISPKPWRVGMRTRYPLVGKDRRSWMFCYDKQAAEFAVCESIGRLGSRDIPDSIQAVIEFHKRLTIQHGARLA